MSTATATATLTGQLLVDGAWRAGEAGEVRAFDPAIGEELEPAFGLATRADADHAAAAAATAFPVFRALAPADRAAFLRSIADGLDAASAALVERAVRETGLPEGRLVGEVARTSGQLRLFAGVLEAGLWEGARIDPALPDRTPLPRVDIRQRKVPLGPVVVFGASNFPFAFSNAGGDTASALAAGCPVIVKAHHAHPGVAELVSRVVDAAVREHGLPGGVYQSLLGSGREIGVALVKDPRVKAVGFTGSRSGGLALVRAAQERPEPIPVYAEMSSINPVFVLPSAAGAALGEAFVGSLTLGSGQFCTNPGLVFVPRGEAGDAFVQAAVVGVRAAAGQPMLTRGIHDAFQSGCQQLGTVATEIARGTRGPGPCAPAPRLFEAPLEQFLAREELSAEVFGAAALIVRYDDPARLPGVAAGLEGQLTATVHVDAGSADADAAARLIAELELRVGRVLVGGWPTGVEVGHAMVHGGPFPSTSDGRTTSVGSLAIERFLRPVAYQSFPAELLPSALRDDAGTPRLVDGAPA